MNWQGKFYIDEDFDWSKHTFGDPQESLGPEESCNPRPNKILLQWMFCSFFLHLSRIKKLSKYQSEVDIDP